MGTGAHTASRRAEARRIDPPRSKGGFTVFFTGLPGSGKSTIASVLMAKLMEAQMRSVTLLDGDVVRKHLSSELGFSRRDRDTHIRRLGFVASEVTKAGGIAICAVIAPYAVARREVREMVERHGGFVEVYVSTPREVCETRDPKGHYAKARAGFIRGFTGIDDPYEVPRDPDVEVDASRMGPERATRKILRCLVRRRFIDVPVPWRQGR